jgi:hypothetical protein
VTTLGLSRYTLRLMYFIKEKEKAKGKKKKIMKEMERKRK